MSLAVDDQRCMFFVGGNKAKSASPTGQSLAGGCTKDWWDSQDNIDTVQGKQDAMAKLMGVNGEGAATVTNTTHTEDGVYPDAYVKITDGDGGGFLNAEIGMIAYHPDSGEILGWGAGLYRIREVDTVNGDWVIIDAQASGPPSSNDGDSVIVGGAWADPKVLIENYLDAELYTQEIFINKDITLMASAPWLWRNWSGSVNNNTWLKVTGFHRVPGDITEPSGAFYQNIKDTTETADTDCFVNVDMGTVGMALIQSYSSENIAVSGFRFHNAPSGQGLFDTAATEWKNMDFGHNVFEVISSINVGNCKGLIISDCCIHNLGTDNQTLFIGDAVTLLVLKNSYVHHEGTACVLWSNGGVFLDLGNMWKIPDAEWSASIINEGFTLTIDSTYLDYSNTVYGAIRVNKESIQVVLDALILNNHIDARAFAVGKDGGSFIAKNVCASYDDGAGNTGELTEVIRLETGGDSGLQKHDIESLLQEDPELDEHNEPLNQLVRTGGTPNLIGDATAIGAIKTMNTDVINTAVLAALTAQGYTTARAPKLDNLDQSLSSVDTLIDAIKAKTDNLPGDPVGVSDLASVDTSAVKLAADGLDNVIVAEPSGSPSGWSFVQCLRWLIMRFFNKHTSDNFSGITVHKADDTVSTRQSVTDSSGTKTVGKVQ